VQFSSHGFAIAVYLRRSSSFHYHMEPAKRDKYHTLVLRSAEGGKKVVAVLDDKLPSSPLALVASETTAPTASAESISQPDLLNTPYLHDVYIPAETAQIFTRSIAQRASRKRNSSSPTSDGHLSSRLRSAAQAASTISLARATSSALPTLRSIAGVSQSTSSLPVATSRQRPATEGRGPTPAKAVATQTVKPMVSKPAYLKRVQAQVSVCRGEGV
jgi:hypothetical protein